MKDALATTYGRWRSPAGKVFGPVIDWRTWLKTAHLAAMFPLGLGYLVALVVAFAVGGVLIWTIVGPLILIPTLLLTRWAGDMEAWLVRHISRIELRRPPTALERGLSARQQIWARLIDPTTWTGLAYLLVQFPVGLAALIMLSVCGAFVGATVAAPFAIAFSEGTEFTLGDGFVIDTVPESLALVPMGLLALLASVHLLVVLSALHAAWARLMLGSRARAVPAVPQLPEPTPGGPGGRSPAPDQARVAPAGSGPDGLASLTTREKEVLALMARGYSNAEIAEAFVISEGTVKTHTKRVLAKLDLRDRTQAAAFAYESGFVVPGQAIEDQAPVAIETGVAVANPLRGCLNRELRDQRLVAPRSLRFSRAHTPGRSSASLGGSFFFPRNMSARFASRSMSRTSGDVVGGHAQCVPSAMTTPIPLSLSSWSSAPWLDRSVGTRCPPGAPLRSRLFTLHSTPYNAPTKHPEPPPWPIASPSPTTSPFASTPTTCAAPSRTSSRPSAVPRTTPAAAPTS